MPEFDFGIHYSCQSPEGDWESIYRETLYQAELAESLGYSTFSVAEHHFLPDGWIPTPFAMLGALSAVTDRVNLMTNIVVLPLHNPIEVAEYAAVLDLLSGGSFRLGVGLGWRDEEFAAYGIDKRERVSRVEEGMELIRRLLSEESVTYDGEMYSIDDITVMPRPIQQPVPIWYGGQSDPAIQRAARLADAWSISPIETIDELEEKLDVYSKALSDNNRSIDDVYIPLRREAYVAEDDETAWREVGQSLLYEYQDVYGDYDDIGHSFHPEEHEEALEELRNHAKNRFLIGGPETVTEELERYRDIIDFDEVLLRMHFPGMDTDLAEKSIRLVDEEIMPRFQ